MIRSFCLYAAAFVTRPLGPLRSFFLGAGCIMKTANESWQSECGFASCRVVERQILSLSFSGSLLPDRYLFTSYCAVRADRVFQTLSSPLLFPLCSPVETDAAGVTDCGVF